MTDGTTVTIDGPAGAGKSSIARAVADDLGFEFLDTGAMYRAVTLAVMRSGVSWADDAGVLRVADAVDLQPRGNQMYLNDEDVSEEIRSPAVTRQIRHVADRPAIRTILTRLQRRVAAGRCIVTEGRDQGTEVFPTAACKIFLTASPEERARRRVTQLCESGKSVTFEEILAAQNRRDAEDAARPVGALRPAEDAIRVSTDGLSPERVRERVLKLIRDQLNAAG